MADEDLPLGRPADRVRAEVVQPALAQGDALFVVEDSGEQVMGAVVVGYGVVGMGAHGEAVENVRWALRKEGGSVVHTSN